MSDEDLDGCLVGGRLEYVYCTKNTCTVRNLIALNGIKGGTKYVGCLLVFMDG